MNIKAYLKYLIFVCIRLLLFVAIIVNVFDLRGEKQAETALVDIRPAWRMQISVPVVQTEPVATDVVCKEENNPNHDILKYYTQKTEQLFQDIIIEAAGRHQVDPALIKAVILAESSYNPLAISSKGAMGLMQLMPRTALSMGVQDSFNPEHNINGGVKYLKQLLERFDNNLTLALAAYNAGTAKVNRYRDIPPYKSTRTYVLKVLTYYNYYKKALALSEKADNA
jgi:soluble lytic murein transglycosylase-like protein